MSFSLKENESGDPGDVSGIAKDDNLTGIFIAALELKTPATILLATGANSYPCRISRVYA